VAPFYSVGLTRTARSPYNYVCLSDGVWLSLARALRSGRRGRRFKSSHPDQSEAPIRGFRWVLLVLSLLTSVRWACFGAETASFVLAERPFGYSPSLLVVLKSPNWFCSPGTVAVLWLSRTDCFPECVPVCVGRSSASSFWACLLSPLFLARR
jgi:hypothetical protein